MLGWVLLSTSILNYLVAICLQNIKKHLDIGMDIGTGEQFPADVMGNMKENKDLNILRIKKKTLC